MQILFLSLLLAVVVHAQHDELLQRANSPDQKRIFMLKTKSAPAVAAPNPDGGNYYYLYQTQQQAGGTPGGNPPSTYYFVSLSDYGGAAMQQRYDGNPLLNQFQSPGPVGTGGPMMDFGPPQQSPYFPRPSMEADLPQPEGMGNPFGIHPLLMSRGSIPDKSDGGAVEQPEVTVNETKDDAATEDNNNKDGSSASDERFKQYLQVIGILPGGPAALTRSDLGMQQTFTNAHHYPFPQGLMRLAYHQTREHSSESASKETSSEGIKNPQNVPMLPPDYYSRFPHDMAQYGMPMHFSRLGNKEHGSMLGNQNPGKQSGKSNSDSDKSDDSSATPVRIYTYPLRGFSHLGPLYVPTYESQSGKSNSRV